MRYVYRSVGMVLMLCLACAGILPWEAFASDAPLEFILYPVQTGFSRNIFPVGAHIEVAFVKEPDYAGDTVYRNALRIGDAPSDFIGMAYDVAGNRLYIDHNRNLDLTDDGPGIVGDDRTQPGYGYFRDVAIEVTHNGIPVPYNLTIRFYGDFYFNAFVQSGWSGDVDIAGIQCEMGIVDNMDGIFSSSDAFRLDHARHRELRQDSATARQVPFPKWIHVEGRNFLVECAWRLQDDTTTVAVTLTPITEALMEINFEGQFVSRVVLVDNNARIHGLLDWPQPVMRIPQGTYFTGEVCLWERFSGYPRRDSLLEAGGNTSLKVGGPVRQEVSVARTGRYLRLDYALLGVNDTKFTAIDYFGNRPEFVVYRGDAKVAAGNFEYG